MWLFWVLEEITYCLSAWNSWLLMRPCVLAPWQLKERGYDMEHDTVYGHPASGSDYKPPPPLPPLGVPVNVPWTLLHMVQWSSGEFLRFGGILESYAILADTFCDITIKVPYFWTSCVSGLMGLGSWVQAAVCITGLNTSLIFGIDSLIGASFSHQDSCLLAALWPHSPLSFPLRLFYY